MNKSRNMLLTVLTAALCVGMVSNPVAAMKRERPDHEDRDPNPRPGKKPKLEPKQEPEPKKDCEDYTKMIQEISNIRTTFLKSKVNVTKVKKIEPENEGSEFRFIWLYPYNFIFKPLLRINFFSVLREKLSPQYLEKEPLIRYSFYENQKSKIKTLNFNFDVKNISEVEKIEEFISSGQLEETQKYFGKSILNDLTIKLNYFLLLDLKLDTSISDELKKNQIEKIEQENKQLKEEDDKAYKAWEQEKNRALKKRKEIEQKREKEKQESYCSLM